MQSYNMKLNKFQPRKTVLYIVANFYHKLSLLATTIIIFMRAAVRMVRDGNINVKANVKLVYRLYNYITSPEGRKLKIMRAFISRIGD